MIKKNEISFDILSNTFLLMNKFQRKNFALRFVVEKKKLSKKGRRWLLEKIMRKVF